MEEDLKKAVIFFEEEIQVKVFLTKEYLREDSYIPVAGVGKGKVVYLGKATPKDYGKSYLCWDRDIAEWVVAPLKSVTLQVSLEEAIKWYLSEEKIAINLAIKAFGEERLLSEVRVAAFDRVCPYLKSNLNNIYVQLVTLRNYLNDDWVFCPTDPAYYLGRNITSIKTKVDGVYVNMCGTDSSHVIFRSPRLAVVAAQIIGDRVRLIL